MGLDQLGPEDPAARPGRRILRGAIETYRADEPFDVVSLVDVIEHVRDPVETMRIVKRLHRRPLAHPACCLWIRTGISFQGSRL